MINVNQRRDVAREIRQFLSVPPNERAWDHDGLQTVGRLVKTSVGENILVRLADLIDPTCCMEPEGEGFRCSSCGSFYDCSGFEEFPWPHCPNCGARVVSGDE